VMDLLKQAADQYGNIDLPKLQNLVLQNIPPTALAEIRQNPQYKAEQAQADAQLNDVINSGGLTLADKAALDAIRTRSGRATGATNNAVLEGAANRGTLDSGTTLLAQLANNQSNAQNQAQDDESQAAQAQTRALQAIAQRGQNATANLNTDWQEQAQVAAAKDAIARGNVAIQNAATTYNANLPQQNFNNQLTLAGAKAGALTGLAGAYGASAKDQNQLGINSVVANAAKTIGAIEGGGQSPTPNASNESTSTSGLNQQAETGASTKSPGQDANPQALTGQQTKGLDAGGDYVQVGYDGNGEPIFHRRRQQQGQNF
jgi:hypothetical protein